MVLRHRDAQPPLGQKARGRQTGKAGADDKGVNLYAGLSVSV